MGGETSADQVPSSLSVAGSRSTWQGNRRTKLTFPGLLLGLLTFLSLSCAAEATAPTAALTPVKPTVTFATVTPTLPIYAIPIRTPRSVALEATAQAEAAATPVATVTPVVTVTPVGAGASGPTPIVSGPTPTPTPAPSPTDTPVPTDTPTPPPTDTPTPTPTVTPTPTPTPGPVFGQEFADRELAKIQEFIPFRTVRGDLAQLCSELKPANRDNQRPRCR